MSKTAADQIVEMMIDVGIQRVYGLVGDSINPLTDAIRRTKGKLQWVHCRNEEVGAFAAGAQGLLKGGETGGGRAVGGGNPDLTTGGDNFPPETGAGLGVCRGGPLQVRGTGN